MGLTPSPLLEIDRLKEFGAVAVVVDLPHLALRVPEPAVEVHSGGVTAREHPWGNPELCIGMHRAEPYWSEGRRSHHHLDHQVSDGFSAGVEHGRHHIDSRDGGVLFQRHSRSVGPHSLDRFVCNGAERRGHDVDDDEAGLP